MQGQVLARLLTMQAPVVSKMVSANHQINHYQMDLCIRKMKSIIYWID